MDPRRAAGPGPGRPIADGPLPRLREDIRLVERHGQSRDRTSWLVFDPLRDQYIELEALAFHALTLWHKSTTAADLADQTGLALGRVVAPEEIGQLVHFAESMALLEVPAGHWAQLRTRAKGGQGGWLMWLVHNYLSLHIPLLRPQRMLERSLPLMRVFASAPVLLLITVMGLLGAYLASRQIDVFLATLPGFFTLDGLALFFVALCLVKIMHELGHAYVAVHYGARVSSMGVAVLMLAPMLYTDVSDAWRLPVHRQRMLIDAAGVLVELAVAAVALFFWVFLPDGLARTCAFALATTGIATSLLLNLNPFMRFDGYYLLADAFGIANMQTRAFGLARWKLREWLFDLREPCPESFSRSRTALLILYGYATWCYRLVVFTGIALLVYTLFFKALGLALFAVEMLWFIILPVWREFGEWSRRRKVLLSRRRGWASTAVLACLGALLVWPWSGRVSAPGQLEPAGFLRVFPPVPARIAAIHVQPGQIVRAGMPILTLHLPQLAHERQTTEIRLGTVDARLARRVADPKDRSVSLSLEEERDKLAEKLRGLRQQQEELVVRAARDGVLADFDVDLAVGQSLTRQDLIGIIVTPDQWIVRGYLDQDDAWRISAGSQGRFVPDDPRGPVVPVQVRTIAEAAAAGIDIATLASVHGGSIPVRSAKDQSLVPDRSVYPVEMVAPGALALPQIRRGVVLLDGVPESLLARFWRRALRVLVQESGA